MKITPVMQNNINKTNFKGASSQLPKYSEEVMDAISSSISDAFANVLPKAGKNEKPLGPIYSRITKGIAKGIGALAPTNTSKKLVEGLNHFKKPSARMADLASIAITFFYVNNTMKSKKIDEDRKMPLAINNVTVTVVSSTMAALIDKASDVFLDRVKGAFYHQKGVEVLDKVIEKVPSLAKENENDLAELGKTILQSKEFKRGLKDYTKRVEKAKSLTIFSFVVRFLVTVLMVPVAGKLVSMIKNSAQKNTDNTDAVKSDKKDDNDDNKTELKTEKDDDNDDDNNDDKKDKD